MAEKVTQTRTVSPNGAKTSIQHCLALKRPIMVWGAPGIGKSDIVKQIGNEDKREVIDIRLPLWVVATPFWVVGTQFWVVGTPCWVVGTPFWGVGTPFWGVGRPFWVVGTPF